MILADEIREYVLVCYIKPTRRRNLSTVEFSASAIHEGMGLVNHYPAICGAIDADKFLELAHVTLVKRDGPHQSNTAKWIYRV